ncbi:PGAP1-domain-containing protein [Nadsonia fulvescens var. elongata DSM 6958]|uniref:GPI inositol-deacylase n=1 Tax=Nadsonia fulvescens var. elongata DSM 6958 TaxID=857566 RepID=A0A1E3PS57_9ASCO|nr:PGAP1-domain-containing protein [Nadsonia fulvescens var. elongata DSM 6958]
MSYTNPSYIKMKDFDQSKSRLSSKYSLYLYRELGVDKMPQPDGIPVIFIPGNAGSYRQVRALAAGAAEMFRDEYQSNLLVQNLDFFTADFNEDLAAFHGQSLLDQAEYINDAISYILSLYKRNTKAGLPIQHYYPHPESVMIIGHSMGGFVARTMVTLPNYKLDSISTIITLATPHTVPPLSFDSDLVSVYDNVNRYWKNSFANVIKNQNPLASLSIISLAGGNLDYMIPSEYSVISPVIPATNGLTVFTTTIPNVWRSIDHQSIIWCDELRKVLIRTLFEVVDIRANSKLKPVTKRMKIFGKYLLPGIENIFHTNSNEPVSSYSSNSSNKEDVPEFKSSSTDSSANDELLLSSQEPPDTILIIDDLSKTIVPPSDTLRLSRLGATNKRGHSYLLPIPENGSKVLSILTDQKVLDPLSNSVVDPQNINLAHLTISSLDGMVKDNTARGLYLFACTLPENYMATGTYLSMMDVSSENYESQIRTSLICKSLAQESVQIPSSKLTVLDENLDHDAAESQNQKSISFSYLQYETRNLKPYKFIIITDTNPQGLEGFITAEISGKSDISISLKTTIWDLFWLGIKIDLRNRQSIMMNISLNVPLCSLFSFKLKQSGEKYNTKDEAIPLTGKLAKSIGTIHEPLFLPMIRQYTMNGHESKFHLNMHNSRNQHVFFHNVAPYTPFQEGESQNLLGLQIWSDNIGGINADNFQELTFELDWLSTMGRWLMHYRTALGIFPFPIVTFIILIQFVYYNSTGIFISFNDGVSIFLRKLLVWVLGIASILTWAINTSIARSIFYFIEPSLYSNMGEETSLYSSKFGTINRKEFFLGIDEPALWFMGPLFVVVAVGIVIFLDYGVTIIINLVARLMMTLSKLTDNFDGEGFSCDDGTRIRQGDREQYFNPSKLTTVRRLTTVGVLLISVITFIPYQFAFVVACTVQVIAVIKEQFRLLKPEYGKMEAGLSVLACGKSSTKSRNFYNYSFSILMIMLCIVPINVPVLMVWVHDLTVRWKTPFTSHHNLLSVLPIMFLVERTTRRRMIPQMWKLSQVQFTVCMLLYMSSYAFIFGMMHAYWLHHLVNFFSAWLLFIYWGAGKRPTRDSDVSENILLHDKILEAAE